MSVIFLETEINAKPEICYKLSLSVDLHQLSTSKTQEHIVDGVRAGMMKTGDFVTWRAKHFGIWQTLSTKIIEEKPFVYFSDQMIDGAFESMKHEHYFFEKGHKTIMKDVFIFTSPLGILGKIFDFLVLENYMRRFLTERNQTIKTVAESNQWEQFVS